MAELSFFCPMARPPTATGANGKRVGRSGAVYDSERLAKARDSLMAHIATHSPSQPLSGPLSVGIVWLYPTRGRHADGEPYAQKPDIDNSLKLVLDCMQRTGFMADDKQVAEIRAVQAWSETPGLYVRVSQIGSEWIGADTF